MKFALIVVFVAMQVMWKKDGSMVDPEADSNIIIYDDGTLIVDSVRVEDEGEYICVAKNSAGIRTSKPAILELYGES